MRITTWLPAASYPSVAASGVIVSPRLASTADRSPDRGGTAGAGSGGACRPLEPTNPHESAPRSTPFSQRGLHRRLFEYQHVEPARAVDALDSGEFDVARCGGAGDPRQRPGRVEAGDGLRDRGHDLTEHWLRREGYAPRQFWTRRKPKLSRTFSQTRPMQSTAALFLGTHSRNCIHQSRSCPSQKCHG